MAEHSLTTQPSRLLRFYKEAQYADAFVNDGRIRMSQLKAFVDSGDTARDDAAEGHGKMTVPYQKLTSVATPSGKASVVQGDLECGFLCANPIFIFCTSLPEVDIATMKQKMGPHVVDIFNPELFSQELEKSLKKMESIGPVLELNCGQVWYNKGTLVTEALDWPNQEHLAYLQKAPSYAHEKEYRFLSTLNPEKSIEEMMHIDVKLENPSKFVRRLKDVKGRGDR